jgi:hypothetical protein
MDNVLIVFRIARKRVLQRFEKRRRTGHAGSPPPADQKRSTKNEAAVPARENPQEEESEDGDMDGMEDMVLRTVVQPPLNHCKGYWVVHNRFPDSEALVEKVDLERRQIVVEYCDTENEAILDYDDPHLEWFRMSSEAELERERSAAQKIQSIMRGR